MMKNKQCGCDERTRTWCEKHYFEMYGIEDNALWETCKLIMSKKGRKQIEKRIKEYFKK